MCLLHGLFYWDKKKGEKKGRFMGERGMAGRPRPDGRRKKSKFVGMGLGIMLFLFIVLK